MVWLASYANKGVSQAALTAVVTLLFSLFFPPLFWVNGALIGFLFLCRPKADFIKIVLITVLFSYLVLQIGSGVGVIVFGLVFLWLPILFAAAFVKHFDSFSIGLEMSVVAALLLVLVLLAFSAQSNHLWLEVINQVFPEDMASSGQQPNMRDMLVKHIDSLSGWLVAGIVLGSFVSLSLARYWQKLLVLQQSFTEEFIRIRFSRSLSVIGLGLYLLSLFYSGMLIENITPVIMIGFFFIGLAVAHGFMVKKIQKPLLLVLFYIVLVLMFPLVSFFLTLLGLTDYWLQYRKKFL